MVVNFPTVLENPWNNPLRSHTFIVSTIVMIPFLCGKKKNRRSLSLDKQIVKPDENTDLLFQTSNEAHSLNKQTVKPDENTDVLFQTSKVATDANYDPPVQNEKKELPPPPRLASIKAASYHVGGSSNRSQSAKLTSSLSMRLSGRLKGLKKGVKNDEKGNDLRSEKDKMTRGDSLLKKTIILGEKCRIPDEDEDEIILDENGQRITTFHRKQSCSSMPRQSSDADHDVFHSEHQN